MRDEMSNSAPGFGAESSTEGGCDSEATRGQSELVGFILVFGVVVLALALVGMAGFVGLDNAQDFQRTTNAEMGFTALAADVDEVVRGGSPSRSTEIRISDARLAVEDPETITVTINVTDEEDDIERSVETRPIVYDSGSGTTITYHSGALVRSDDGNDVLFGEPSFVLTEELVVLPLIDISQAGTGTVGGTTRADVRSRNGGTETVATMESDEEVNLTVNVTTSNLDAWVRYFEDAGLEPEPDREHGSVEVTIATDRAQVTVHRVDVEFR